LEILLVEARARRLAGYAEDRDRIGRGRIEAGDHVGAGRTRGADAQADIAGAGPGIAFRHVACALDVAGKDMADRAPRLQRRIEGVDRRARYAEGTIDAFLLQNQDRCIDSTHFSHGISSVSWRG